MVVVPQNKEDIEFKSSAIRIDVLEEKQSYPFSKKDINSLMFNKDIDASFIKSLIKGKTESPCLYFRILYKNSVGACFAMYSDYVLSIPKDSGNDFKEYYSSISSFPIKYNNEIANLKRLKEDRSDDWDSSFDELNSELKKSLNSESEKISLDIFPIPQSFEIHLLTKKQYIDTVSKLSYSTPIALIDALNCGRSKNIENHTLK